MSRATELADKLAAGRVQDVSEIEDEIRRLDRANTDMAAELQFLASDLLYWVDRAVYKGNANSDIEEAYERYEQWLRNRAALTSSTGETNGHQ